MFTIKSINTITRVKIPMQNFHYSLRQNLLAIIMKGNDDQSYSTSFYSYFVLSMINLFIIYENHMYDEEGIVLPAIFFKIILMNFKIFICFEKFNLKLI